VLFAFAVFSFFSNGMNFPEMSCFVSSGRETLTQSIGGAAYSAALAVARFLCPMGNHCCLPYHFSASKLILLPFHIELIRIAPMG